MSSNQNMFYPRISIIMPSYNQDLYIQDAIESVIVQNYPNLEFILIDGGSTDSTVDIIKRYEKYLSYWVSEPDQGHGHALNKGFSKSTGEIMAWLNSDDKYVPGAFTNVAEIFLQFPDVNWITGKTGVWDKQGNLYKEYYKYKNIYDYILSDYGWIQQESVFWRRGLWDKAGGFINENYKFMVDGELWTRFFLIDELWHVNARLSGYRMHDTNRATLYRDEVLREMEKAIAAMKEKVYVDQITTSKQIQSFSPYLDETKLINYKIIDKINDQWRKKSINYFLVKQYEEIIRRSEQNEGLQIQNEELGEELQSVYSSKSWRLTALLRAFLRLVRKGIKPRKIK
ncbi:glycosyltransferase [Sporomusa sphaeroides DSM 2875]|uniref:glycosyltransferase family 2 protein n=1 Tax=Sporomusa sphaeroides TaxID=47679 RepID=UPI002030DE74|nr:glycosyltransferase family 2 protein [Sporomusa sphaeroides]MCM0758036.1 glycosyltransferase [Sporomusa sphaeroides DSM 2875]